MQGTKARRFLCSTASQSSPSNTTIITCKKGRMSSAGGESLLLNRDVGAVGDVFEGKANIRAPKCSRRPLAKGARNSGKNPKPSKASKPNFGSLQNAVVLAPFHTLKRCFQNKLVDLYTYEKMKKMNQKAKMAKRRNMAFEYDVIEMETLKSRAEKEAQKGKNIQKQKSRSPSYCQCKKIRSKVEQKLGRIASNKAGKANARDLLPSKAPRFSGQSGAKRRKVDRESMPLNLKAEWSPRLGFYSPRDRFHFSDANQSSSAVSSRSKCDSWETFSNSPSGKEEHIQGSFAVSTTSFDSYLENFEKGSWDFAESSNKNTRRENYKKPPQEPLDPDFLPKPTVQFSRHLIMQVDKKSSDGEIVDFMDREPKSQMIRFVESSQKWQPLRRQSKAREKKFEEKAPAGYNLRSLSTGPHKDSRRINQSHVPKRRSRGSSRRFESFQIEVATQVGGGASETGSNANFFENSPLEPPAETPDLREQNTEGNNDFFCCSKARSLPEESPNDLSESPEIQLVECEGSNLEPSVLGERSDVPSMEDEQFGDQSASFQQEQQQEKEEEEPSFFYRARSNANTLEDT